MAIHISIKAIWVQTQALIMQLKLQDTLLFLLDEPVNARAKAFRGASFFARAANGRHPGKTYLPVNSSKM